MVYERYSYNASCPPLPAPNPTELASEAAKLMTSAGIRSCEQSSSVQTAEFQAKLEGPLGLGSASAGGKITNTNTSSIGCEQVMSITNKYREAKNNVSCMLKSTKNVTRTTATGVNSIIFKAGRDAIISCPRLNITQGMKLTLISNFKLSEQETKLIENETKSVAKEIIKAVQDTNTGLAATPQGSKFISDTIKDINETNYRADINETLNEITTSVTGKNELLFEAGRDLKITGDDCVIKQDMVIDLIAASVVESTLSDMLKTLSERIEETQTDLEQKSEAAGADKLDDFGDIEAGKNEARKYLYIGVAVVIGLVVVSGVIFGIMKMKGSSSAPPSRIFSPRQQLFSKEINPYIFIGVILFLVYYGSKKEGFEKEKKLDIYDGF